MTFDFSLAGVLPDHAIAELFRGGAIQAPDLAPGQIQPASLDLRIGTTAHSIRASFLPGETTVHGALERVLQDTYSLKDGESLTIRPGSVFIVPLMEFLALPAGLQARANPKSSTGRLDIFVRLLCDRSTAYDVIPEGYRGPLWLEIAPKTFPIRIRAGSRLAQIRFKRDALPLDDTILRTSIANGSIHVTDTPLVRDGLCMGLDLNYSADQPAGWRAKRHTDVIDVDRVGVCDVREFFEPIYIRRGGGLILDPDEFYILASRERITIPSHLAAEMIPFDASIGEIRCHYAGFFDPGFGTGQPSRGVLEVRAHDVPFLIDHGQPVARLAFEAMAASPQHIYGASGTSNYQGQGLRLSKHFKVNYDNA